jgi:hypothetical protein
VIDPWKAFERTIPKLGEGPIKTRREVFLDCGSVSLNDVVIIQEPLSASSESFPVVCCLREPVVDPSQGLSITAVIREKARAAADPEGTLVLLSQSDGEVAECFSRKNLSSPRYFTACFDDTG